MQIRSRARDSSAAATEKKTRATPGGHRHGLPGVSARKRHPIGWQKSQGKKKGAGCAVACRVVHARWRCLFFFFCTTTVGGSWSGGGKGRWMEKRPCGTDCLDSRGGANTNINTGQRGRWPPRPPPTAVPPPGSVDEGSAKEVGASQRGGARWRVGSSPDLPHTPRRTYGWRREENPGNHTLSNGNRQIGRCPFRQCRPPTAQTVL